MSYKKLKVKYGKMFTNENQIPKENFMPYTLNDVFQAVLKQRSEEVIIVDDIKPTENLNTSNSFEPLNLSKPVAVESPASSILEQSSLKAPKIIKEEDIMELELTADKGKKRPASDILAEPILKAPKMMDEETGTKQKLIRILPLLSTIQNINSANIVYGFPAGTASPLTPSAQSKKKSNAGLNEAIQNIIAKNCIIQNGIEMVKLGPNGTTIERENLAKIDWLKSNSAVTRNILKHIFSLEILATHNLSGKKSPAFCDMDMPEKGQLDPLVIADVVHFMDLTLNMTEKEVKMAVTSTCADAGKKRKRSSSSEEKEKVEE